MRCPSVLAFLLLAPLGLGGCGAVSGVRTAFEMPVVPTPSPRELARARQTRGFDSLSKSLQKLNAQTVRTLFGTTSKPAATNALPARQPAPFAPNPAGALARDLSRGANVPVAPHPVAVSVEGALVSPVISAPVGSAATRTLPPRRIQSERVPGIEGGVSETAQEFLEEWAARESLRRSDEERLGRRALEDRIAQQSRATRSEVDLSLVPPETRLRLSNLRLKLLPLLKVPPAQRVSAKEQIEAIEAELYEVWQQETERQNALLRQTAIEVPARLRREGESALELQTREGRAQTQTRIAEVRHDMVTRSAAAALPSLSVVQRAATSPDPALLRAHLGLSVARGLRNSAGASPAPLKGNSEIARRGTGTSSRIAQSVNAKNQKVWDAAIR